MFGATARVRVAEALDAAERALDAESSQLEREREESTT
jgi:hypothetical protein